MSKKAIISVFSNENENNEEPISVTTPGEFLKKIIAIMQCTKKLKYLEWKVLLQH